MHLVLDQYSDSLAALAKSRSFQLSRILGANTLGFFLLGDDLDLPLGLVAAALGNPGKPGQIGCFCHESDKGKNCAPNFASKSTRNVRD